MTSFASLSLMFSVSGSKSSIQTNEQNLTFKLENKWLLLCVAGSSTSSVDGDLTGQTAKPHEPSDMEQDVKVWFVFYVMLRICVRLYKNLDTDTECHFWICSPSVQFISFCVSSIDVNASNGTNP